MSDKTTFKNLSHEEILLQQGKKVSKYERAIDVRHNEYVLVNREKHLANARHARSQQRTNPKSKERAQSDTEIAEYLARNPPKVW